MARVTRRDFLLAAGALSSGCANLAPSAAPNTASVRAPAVDQTWRYAKYDRFSGQIIDTVVDRVTAVGATVELRSFSEGYSAPPTAHSWGENWLQPHSREAPAGPMPSEIQHPWGMVLVDPHWGDIQVFRQAIPLWPAQLQPGWSKLTSTEYKTPDHEGPLPWQLYMVAHQWEDVAVPAGRFRTLRYTNLINFGSVISGRSASQRRETLWFAPETGRWVAREGSGSYMLSDSVATQQFSDVSYRWELLNWA